jgi:hypothetical protein
MKVAHFYPGLKYKSSVVPRKILRNPYAREAIEQASRLIEGDALELCKIRDDFASTRECFVMSLATGIASWRHYSGLSKYLPANIIIGSSFGHYAGLVMAGCLDYQDALEAVSLQGELIDRKYSNHKTFLLRGIPLLAVKAFIKTCGGTTFVGNFQKEGIALTFHQQFLPPVQHFVNFSRGKMTEVPLRPIYHAPFPKKLNHALNSVVNPLPILPPQVPFLSTYNATVARTVIDIKKILIHWIDQPHRLEAASIRLGNHGIKKVVYLDPTGAREGK